MMRRAVNLRITGALGAAGLLAGGATAPAHAVTATDEITAVAASTAGASTATSNDAAESPAYAPPSLDDVSAETMAQARLSDGEGSQVLPGTERSVQIESPAHFHDTPYTLGQEVDLWIIPPEGEDGQYFGTFDVESDGDPDRYWSFLGPVTFPPEAFDYSGVYAAALTDANGELLAWQRTVLELEGEEVTEDSPGGTETGTWPVPAAEDPQPSTDPPTVDDLTEDGYGRIYIQEDSPVIPLDRSFTAVIQGDDHPADYWLLPPDGREAIWIPTQSQQGDGAGEVSAELLLDSADVDFTGIYALAAVGPEENVMSWTPFGLSVDAQSIQPGDPGVNAEDSNTDRSIFPIPGSVSAPEDNGNGSEEQEPESQEENTSPPEGDDGEESTAENPADSAAASDTNPVNGWVIALAGAAGALVIAGLVYLVGSRRRRTRA